MGKKHRERRKRLKKAVREIPKGWMENELGQLKKKVSKAEARERYLRAWGVHLAKELAQEQILGALAERAKRDIDEEVLGPVWDAIEASQETASP